MTAMIKFVWLIIPVSIELHQTEQQECPVDPSSTMYDCVWWLFHLPVNCSGKQRVQFRVPGAGQLSPLT